MTKRLSIITVIALACSTAAFTANELENGFDNPPAQSRPGVWWRWADGNISKEGITRDLTEMARKGIRSAQIFDVAGAAAPTTIGMMTPQWRELFKHAVKEAERLGISLAVVPAAGWGTGGPWIGPEDAAKALRYAEIQVDGPGTISRTLPRAEGPAGYYTDIAVVAFRERAGRPVQPAEVTASSVYATYYAIERNWPPAYSVDGDPGTFWKTARPPSATDPAWIEVRYHEPLTANSLYIAGAKDGGPKACELESSDDGRRFRKIAAFDLGRSESRRIEFPSATARFFRVVITSAYTQDVRLAELWLLREGDEPLAHPPVKWWWFKSGNRGIWDYPPQGPALFSEEYAEDNADCRSSEVVDLSARMHRDGKLEWQVPPGRWTIARFGAVLLGEPPRVMSRALKGGYDADPLSARAADKMFDSTARILLQDAGEAAGKTLKAILVDSWEYGAGAQGMQPTWTDGFREKFKERRGYDPVVWLPAMARRIVDSRAKTNRFFWDWRVTMADAYLDFYGRLTARAKQNGLQSTAECGYGSYPFQHIDGLAAFGRVDVPMGEFWFGDTVMSQFFRFVDTVRTAASSAHTYGRKFVSAETLTLANGTKEAPGAWKSTLDRELANGLNLPMLSVWSHQYDIKARPGLFTFDSINCNMTWWEQSQAYLSYLARAQFLLQQGQPVADACYFFGEGSCKFVPAKEMLKPALPAGYEFDGINAEVIVQRLAVRNRRLVLPEGITYRYLVLPAEAGWRVTAPTLRKVKALVEGGATVIGPKPAGAAGLRDYPKQDQAVAAMANALWGEAPGDSGVRKVSRGRVIWGKALSAVMSLDRIEPDIAFEGGAKPDSFKWCHRRTEQADIYFISNQEHQAQTVTAIFRVHGKQPELWDAVSGKRRAAAYSMAEGRTSIPLELAGSGSIFVVFRKPASQVRAGGRNFAVLDEGCPLARPWTVTFDPTWGGPARPVAFTRLEDWTKRPEPGIRNYSGKATYKTTFDLPARPKSQSAIYLDLGTVKDIAQVRLNGKDMGVVWTAPWRVEITGVVKTTGNRLEIDVVNVWMNRLLADADLPPEKRLTRINSMMYGIRKSPPLASGLLGPVRLRRAESR